VDIDKDSIDTQQHKTDVAMDWPQPENSKYVRGLLGHPSYYRNSLNTTLTLQYSFLELANLAKIERILGGNLGS
jgi:hypothetical protein